MRDGMELAAQIVVDVVILTALTTACIITGSGLMIAATISAFVLALIGFTV
jgi:hypothetical protein